MDQVLLPELLANCRDLGGLPTTDGRTVRPGRLLRSATLAGLAPESAGALTTLTGAGTYVDLRTDEEIERDGAPHSMRAAGWHWLREPLRDRAEADGGDTDDDCLRRYRAALSRYLAIADQVLGLLNDKPVLVGCSLGKDRTGLVIALVLSRLGVQRANILADFAASNASLAARRHLLPARWQDPTVPVNRVNAQVCAAMLDTAEQLWTDTAPSTSELARRIMLTEVSIVTS